MRQQFVAIPECLAGFAGDRRWVGWRWETRSGKRTKPPRTVINGRTNGYAKNDDPSTWSVLADAETAWAAGEIDGIGLQLLDLEGFAAIDLDDVRDPETGDFLPWARDIIADSGSYAELTPSGTGARILGKVQPGQRLHQGKTKHPDGGSFELYLAPPSGRYITVTGSRIPGSPAALADISGVIATLRGAKVGNLDGIDLTRRTPRFEEMPEWLRATISHGWSGDRSADFQRAVNGLAARVDFETALEWFGQHPNGPASKYAGRLEPELRRSWRKAEASADDSAPGEPPKDTKAKAKKASIAILSTSTFLSTWAPQSFLWKGIIEEGRLLTMCGPTGTGKTAIALLMTKHIALGQALAGRRTRKASVLFLAGENPLDVKTRWLTMLRRDMIDPDTVDVFFVEGRFSIEQQLDTIRAHIAEHQTGLVIPDTLQAFFDGDDSNSNDQMKAAAFGFREISRAGPAVLIPAHPKKGATRDSNVPYGGGALLNEVDGNLSLWGSQAGIELHWCGKFRGSFDPLYFALDVCQVPGALDRDGDPINTVTARPIEAEEAEEREEALNGELMRLLNAIRDNPGATIESLGAACAPMAGLPGWSRSNTDRRINALIARGLVEKSLGKVVLTAKGGRILDGQ